MSSRGMGAMNPSKMPGPKRKARRDDTDFTEYASGGLTPKNPGNLAGKHSTMPKADLENALKKAQSSGNKSLENQLSNEQDIRTKLGAAYAGGGMASEKWIQGAISKPGALRKSLGVKEGKNIPTKALAKAAKAPGTMGKRARLAQTLKKLGK